MLLQKSYNVIKIVTMKKYLLISLCFVAGSMLAAETAYVGMKLTGETTASATNFKIRLTEDDAYTHGYDDGADAEILSLNPSNSQSVFLFAMVDTKRCSSIYDNLVKDLHVGFQTNRVDNKYSITFTTVEGRSLKFYDAANDSTFLITSNNQVYSFEVNASNYPAYVAGTNMLIEDRFIIEPVFEFKVCVTFDQIEIYDNPSKDNIVVTDMEGTTVKDEPYSGRAQVISMTDQPSGHYFLTVNGETYEFCNKPQPKE